MTTERHLNDPEPAVYMIPEVALLLRCDRRTVVRMIARGELRAVRVGRDWRVLRKSVETFLAGESPAPIILTPKATTTRSKAKPATKTKGRK